MSKMFPFDPWSSAASLRDAMNRLWEEGITRPGFPRFLSMGQAPAIEAYETEDEIAINAAVPGLKSEDVDVSITGESVTIAGRIAAGAQPPEEARVRWIARELQRDHFSRTIELPVGVDSERATARIESGLLTIKLPKSVAEKPKQIKVASREQSEG